MRISWEEAGCLHMGNMGKSPLWKGKARVYARPGPLFDCDVCMDRVGDMLVVGDPEMVARIARLGRLR
jgi:hypothetical protein